MANDQDCLTYADLVNSFGASERPAACIERHLSLCPKCAAVRGIIQELIRDEITPQETFLLDCVKLPSVYQTMFRNPHPPAVRPAPFSGN